MTRLFSILIFLLIVAVFPAAADPGGPVLEMADYTCVVPPGIPCPPTSREVILYFDESIDPVTAAEPANYLFHPVGDPESAIPLEEIWGIHDNEVGLFFVTTPDDVDYLLTVSGVEDLDGNAMEPQSWVIEVRLDPDSVPDVIAPTLLANAPNPFNPATEVRFVLPTAGQVELAAYDLAGRRLVTIWSGHAEAGSHGRTWHADGLPSGSYLIRMRVGEFVSEQKVSLVR